MSNLPDNPYLAEAERIGSDSGLAQAILALAFEQRTANLIAAMQPVRVSGGKEWQMDEEHQVALNKMIAERLGL